MNKWRSSHNTATALTPSLSQHHSSPITSFTRRQIRQAIGQQRSDHRGYWGQLTSYHPSEPLKYTSHWAWYDFWTSPFLYDWVVRNVPLPLQTIFDSNPGPAGSASSNKYANRSCFEVFLSYGLSSIHGLSLTKLRRLATSEQHLCMSHTSAIDPFSSH